ncbi:MAG: undecaprenyl-diphosphate phosphatase [Clostridiaceae bacterium]|nr:undecaprenyl-diphosphate phosphatase [Clostridiaceae bacterium]
MSLIDAIILGVIQGLTEFLPVSSSGHLVFFQRLLGVDEAAVLTFSVAVHVATLFAVVFVYWKKIFEMIKRPFSKLPLQIVAATIPAVVLTLLFGDLIESTYVNPVVLGPGFIFTGLALLFSEKVGNGQKGLEELKTTDSLMIGAAQGIALFPAVSRSGMTITTSLALGLERGFAADFSFLMSIPPILGAALLDGIDVVKGNTASFESIGTINLLAGMIAAGITGFFAIKIMLKAVKKLKLKYFSYYVITLGTIIILAQLLFKDSLSWLK